MKREDYADLITPENQDAGKPDQQSAGSRNQNDERMEGRVVKITSGEI